jgi:hypothetical protein
VNRPVGPPALEICAVADHLAHAARAVAILGFLLRVLRWAATEGGQNLRIASWRKPRVFPPRARPQDPTRFFRAGAVAISGSHGHVNPRCSLRARTREFRQGGRCSGGKFLRLRVNRVSWSPRACRRFCRGFFSGTRGAVAIASRPPEGNHRCDSRAWPKSRPPRAFQISGRLSQLGTGGGIRRERARSRKTPRSLRANIWRVFQKICHAERRGIFGLRALIIAL